VGIFLLAGCGAQTPEPTASPLPTQKSTMETLTIYTIDSDSMSLTPVVVKKQKDTLTPEYIVSLVEQNLDDDEIGIDYAEQRGDAVIVSFLSGQKPVKGCSKKMEKLILNCFAGSLLDNVPDCTQIIYRCEDKAYKSEHRSFGRDEVYASE
jgi:hypothetical protein